MIATCTDRHECTVRFGQVCFESATEQQFLLEDVQQLAARATNQVSMHSRFGVVTELLDDGNRGEIASALILCGLRAAR